VPDRYVVDIARRCRDLRNRTSTTHPHRAAARHPHALIQHSTALTGCVKSPVCPPCHRCIVTMITSIAFVDRCLDHAVIHFQARFISAAVIGSDLREGREIAPHRQRPVPAARRKKSTSILRSGNPQLSLLAPGNSPTTIISRCRDSACAKICCILVHIQPASCHLARTGQNRLKPGGPPPFSTKRGSARSSVARKFMNDRIANPQRSPAAPPASPTNRAFATLVTATRPLQPARSELAASQYTNNLSPSHDYAVHPK